jgi:hypothetical protein
LCITDSTGAVYQNEQAMVRDDSLWRWYFEHLRLHSVFCDLIATRRVRAANTGFANDECVFVLSRLASGFSQNADAGSAAARAAVAAFAPPAAGAAVTACALKQISRATRATGTSLAT